LNLTGGILPYVLNWAPYLGTLHGDTIINMPAGIYLFSISDSNG